MAALRVSCLRSDDRRRRCGGIHAERHKFSDSGLTTERPDEDAICGRNLDAPDRGAVPRTLEGAWTPPVPAVSYAGTGFSFTGEQKILDTGGNTDIAIENVIVGEDCIKIEVAVTGRLPRAAHDQSIGEVTAEWINRSGAVIGTLAEESVYWNSERFTLDDSGDSIPESAVQLRVRASISGDANAGNNEVLRDYSPDWSIVSFDWVSEDGVNLTYAVEGNDVGEGAAIGLFWGERPAWDGTTESAPGSYSIHVPATQIAAPNEGESQLFVRIDYPNQYFECDETNNEKELELVTSIDTRVELSGADTQFRDEPYGFEYVVTNRSPVRLKLEITAGWTTSNPKLTPPNPLMTQESVLPGVDNAYKVSGTEFHTWEWIDPVSPLDKSFEPAPLTGLLSDIERIIGKLYKPAKIIE